MPASHSFEWRRSTAASHQEYWLSLYGQWSTAFVVACMPVYHTFTVLVHEHTLGGKQQLLTEVHLMATGVTVNRQFLKRSFGSFECIWPKILCQLIKMFENKEWKL